MIDIKINESMVYIDVNKEGRQFKKVTNLNTFRESIGIVKEEYDSGWLPGKTGVKRIVENNDIIKYVYIHPGGRRKLHYSRGLIPRYEDDHGYTEENYAQVGYPKNDKTDDEYEGYLRNDWRDIVNRLYREKIYPDTEFYNVVLPDAFIIATKRKDRSSWSIRIFTLGLNSLFTGHEKLYEYPTPNIYSGSGKVCWGNQEFDNTFDNPLVLQSYLPSLLSSPFNNDLSEGRLIHSVDILNLWKDMDTMIKEGCSDEEVLKLYDGILRDSDYTVNSFI